MYIAVALALWGCGKPVDVAPDVPLDIPENLAPAVPAEGDDRYPENTLTFECGEGTLDETGTDYNWCHSRAYVQHDILAVIEGALEPRVAVDYCNVEFSDPRPDIDPSHEWSIEIHHKARSDLANIEFDVRWVCDSLERDGDDPTVILCTFGMLEGQALFPYFEGSFALLAVDGQDDVVEWQYIEHLTAPTTDQDTVRQTITDIYNDLQAYLTGAPYPECP